MPCIQAGRHDAGADEQNVRRKRVWKVCPIVTPARRAKEGGDVCPIVTPAQRWLTKSRIGGGEGGEQVVYIYLSNAKMCHICLVY